MRVKLYNFSKWPTRQVRNLLEHAAKVSGCKGPVVTKVNRGGRHEHGLAERGCPYKQYLSRKPRDRDGELKAGIGDTVFSNAGFVTLWPCRVGDTLTCVESFYALAVHEFTHIADYQNRERFDGHNKRWADRCQEKRANKAAMFGALGRDRERDNRILDLAVEIELL